MKLLADANVEAALVQWLRAQNVDAAWALEYPPGTSDQHLLDRAFLEERAILTHDLDFGELVFKRLLPSRAILLMRFGSRREEDRLELLRNWWPTLEPLMALGLFIVVSDDSIRSRPLPTSPTLE